MNTLKLTTVFLSGRLESDWQEKVISQIPNLTFFNPKDHQLQSSDKYVAWDLNYIKKADIVFAYMEKDNPSGYGLATEIGYAKGLGKTIILVDEKSKADVKFKQYFAIVREISDVVCESFEEGINLLKKFDVNHSYDQV